MKKELISKILLCISLVLILIFFVFIILDYRIYNASYSAPFSALILVRALEFALPSIVLLVISLVLKGNNKNGNNK